ncbi:hypothetical protein, partial [Escherichia coli]|uniref:hypothetical protein n=1 Tax=Escherichia coli TaxID=562 RepID=UPI001BE454BA
CTESARTKNIQYINCRDFESHDLDNKIQQLATNESTDDDVFFLDNYECMHEIGKKKITVIMKNNPSLRFIFSSNFCAVEEHIL